MAAPSTVAVSPLVLDDALYSVLLTGTVQAPPRLFLDSIHEALWDDYVSDDYDGSTDTSGGHSPDASPMTEAMDFDPMPATKDVPSARPQRRKRKRMSKEERKVRHREVQRQFMKRKRARIAELRIVESAVLKQLRLVSVMAEIAQLRNEKEALEAQVKALPPTEPPASHVFSDLVFSVPTDSANDDVVLTEQDWADFLGLFPAEASSALHADSDDSSRDSNRN